MKVQTNVDRIFDRVIDRRNTYSVKYDFSSRGKPEDVLPLWVADMDFRAPECVTDALIRQSRHGVYGYSDINEPYFMAVKNWFWKRFYWNIERDWLVVSPGVVNAINVAICAFSEPGDGVLIQEPVYHPFASSIDANNRKTVVNELRYENHAYSIDFKDFERKIAGGQVKLFILCSPHNPVGRVWTQDELIKMGEICAHNNVIVISDEIHQDFIHKGHKHFVFEMQNKAFRDIAITCTAPTKTFNLAGLPIANIIIANEQLREKFVLESARNGLAFPGIMNIVACKAAYEGGEEWLDNLLEYLAGNFHYLDEFLSENIPTIKLVKPEGTYLAWLDFHKYKFWGPDLGDKILNEGRLWLNDGPIFGAGGKGFQRMNVACPRIVLWEALKRLEKAARALTK